MFIFARCLRSLAAVTPAKYELDIIQVTTVLIIRKKWENNGTEKIGLVTPTPGSDKDSVKLLDIEIHHVQNIEAKTSDLHFSDAIFDFFYDDC